MRGISYQFDSFRALSLLLESGADEQDVELPVGVSGITDRDWVLAQVAVGDETTSVAACVVDRGAGPRLAFEDRDWRQLWQFANRTDPPSIAPPSLSPPADAAAPEGARVLVVDDDVPTQHILAQLLENAGYLVSAVGTAEEAFDRLRGVAIDLVVLDWMLPGMSGVEFCRRVRKDRDWASLPILFLTAQSSSRDLVQAFRAGADDFVGKPFRAPELQARILGLLRRSRMPTLAPQ